MDRAHCWNRGWAGLDREFSAFLRIMFTYNVIVIGGINLEHNPGPVTKVLLAPLLQVPPRCHLSMPSNIQGYIYIMDITPLTVHGS